MQSNINNNTSSNSSSNSSSINVNVNNSSNNNNNKGNIGIVNKDHKASSSLLGRPRPFQPGAGLMGASPQSPIMSPFIRRAGAGLLPLPLPSKMTGLVVGNATVNFVPSRVNRSNPGSKAKGRRPVRVIPQDHHDSTTESDGAASAGSYN